MTLRIYSTSLQFTLSQGHPFPCPSIRSNLIRPTCIYAFCLLIGTLLQLSASAAIEDMQNYSELRKHIVGTNNPFAPSEFYLKQLEVACLVTNSEVIAEMLKDTYTVTLPGGSKVVMQSISKETQTVLMLKLHTQELTRLVESARGLELRAHFLPRSFTIKNMRTSQTFRCQSASLKMEFSINSKPLVEHVWLPWEKAASEPDYFWRGDVAVLRVEASNYAGETIFDKVVRALKLPPDEVATLATASSSEGIKRAAIRELSDVKLLETIAQDVKNGPFEDRGVRGDARKRLEKLKQQR